MATKELVLVLGVEGGGVCIYRTGEDAGAHRFHVEGVSMRLDEQDDENWHRWTTTPVGTIEAALRSFDPDGRWVYWHPITVLSEYRSAVWQHVQETLRSLASDPPEMWHRNRSLWMAACSTD